MKRVGVYIHFPFCRRRCFYCHFYREEADRDLIHRFINALCLEINQDPSPRYLIDTIYLGGGSPSLLSAGQIHTILEAVSRRFSITDKPEISIEVNPEEGNERYFRELFQIGINRVSLGVQSFQVEDLHYLKRSHTPDQAEKVIRSAGESGFPEVSIDLMIGLPTQSSPSVQANFANLCRLPVDHVSLYLLEGVRGKRIKTTGEREADLYHFSVTQLQSMGFLQYEISNFAKNGHQCRHNLKYWRNREYIAFGPAAARFLDGCDEVTSPNLKQYLAALADSRRPPLKQMRISPPLRRLICGLRLISGLPITAFDPFREQTRWLQEHGLLQRRRSRLAVPPLKMLLLNEILGYFG